MPSRALSAAVVLVHVGFVLACCFPSAEQQAAVKERQEARAAREDARVASVALDRAHLVAIAEAAAGLRSMPRKVCDAAHIGRLREGPPEGVDDTFWDMAWLAELGWLEAAASAGPSKTPPADPIFEDHVSLEVKVAFRQPSSSESGKRRDLEGWGELMDRKPPLLAVVHERRVQQPALDHVGFGPAAGAFTSGAYVADLSLWDIAAEDLLCGIRVEAVSSGEVDLGGLTAGSAQEELAEDFAEQVGKALNEGASALSPGLRVVL